MTIINDWARRHGVSQLALRELWGVLNSPIPQTTEPGKRSEAAGQQRIRLEAPKHGVRLWRNNVGAMPANEDHECPRCHNWFTVEKQPVRYGLANESKAMNKVIKSSDLIGITPVTITAQHLGAILGIFTAYECKRLGWTYRATPAETAQLSFMQIAISMGAIAQFATGPEDIWK